jgi:CRP/FNR family cyclic AMP-dependent transcriptional regulator
MAGDFILKQDDKKMKLQEMIEHLQGVPLLSEIATESDALQYLAQQMQFRSYRPGDIIIKEGDIGSEMYILVRGSATVFKSTLDGDPYKIAVLDGNKSVFFGEGALLDADARNATIKADTECACLILTRTSMDTFSKTHSDWALPVMLKISRSVMDRLNKSNRDLVLLYNALVMEIRGHQ